MCCIVVDMFEVCRAEVEDEADAVPAIERRHVLGMILVFLVSAWRKIIVAQRTPIRRAGSRAHFGVL